MNASARTPSRSSPQPARTGLTACRGGAVRIQRTRSRETSRAARSHENAPVTAVALSSPRPWPLHRSGGRLRAGGPAGRMPAGIPVLRTEGTANDGIGDLQCGDARGGSPASTLATSSPSGRRSLRLSMNDCASERSECRGSTLQTPRRRPLSRADSGRSRRRRARIRCHRAERCRAGNRGASSSRPRSG